MLKAHGVKKGDRVTIYLPMIPEAAYAMLACARIGAIHSVVFGGFSPEAIAGRIADAKSDVVITADEGHRGGRKVPLKANVDAAIEKVGGVRTVIVVRHTVITSAGDLGGTFGCMRPKAAECRLPAEPMNAEDLFILYVRLNRSEGCSRTREAISSHASMTHQYVFDTMATSTGAPPTSAG